MTGTAASAPGSGSTAAGKFLPYLLIVLASLILASNHIVARHLNGVIPPMGFVFWRMVIGAAVVLPFAAPGLIALWPTIRKHWLLFAGMGLLFVPLGNGGIYAAYQYTTAINGGVVSASQPAMTVLLAALILREIITWKQGAGILIAATGVLVIVARGHPETLLHLKFNIGDLLMLVSISFVALHNVLVRKVPSEVSIPQLLFIVQMFGLAATTPLYIAETVYHRPVPLTWEAVGALVWVGVAVTALAVGLINTAIRKIGPNKTSISNYIRVLFTAALAVLLLGEEFQAFHLVAMVLVIGGVFLMTRGRAGG